MKLAMFGVVFKAPQDLNGPSTERAVTRQLCQVSRTELAAAEQRAVPGHHFLTKLWRTNGGTISQKLEVFLTPLHTLKH